MKIKNIKDVETFLKVVNECEGGVTLTSVYGDKYNLKSSAHAFGIDVFPTREAAEMELKNRWEK